MKKNIFFGAAASLMLVACSDTTSIRHIADYEDSLKQIAQTSGTVAILPPRVEVSTVDFSGNKERMYDYEYHMEGVISNSLIPILSQKGFKTKFLTRREIYEKKLEEKMAALNDSFNAAVFELYKLPMWDKKRAFAISSNLNPALTAELKEKTKAEIVVLTQFSAYSKTSGARTLDFAIALLAPRFSNQGVSDKSSMIIGLINTTTGDILWTNMGVFVETFSGEDGKEADEKMINNFLDVVIKPLSLEKSAQKD